MITMSWVWLVVLFAVVIPAVTSRAIWVGRRHHRLRGLEVLDLVNSPGVRERIEGLEAELDQRLEDLETLEARVEELEARLDFTERLAVRHGEIRLPAASDPSV